LSTHDASASNHRTADPIAPIVRAATRSFFMNASEERWSDQNVDPLGEVHAERGALPAVAQLNASPHSSQLHIQTQADDLPVAC